VSQVSTVSHSLTIQRFLLDHMNRLWFIDWGGPIDADSEPYITQNHL